MVPFAEMCIQIEIILEFEMNETINMCKILKSTNITD